MKTDKDWLSTLWSMRSKYFVECEYFPSILPLLLRIRNHDFSIFPNMINSRPLIRLWLWEWFHSAVNSNATWHIFWFNQYLILTTKMKLINWISQVTFKILHLIIQLTIFLQQLVVSIMVLSLKVAFYILRYCAEMKQLNVKLLDTIQRLVPT